MLLWHCSRQWVTKEKYSRVLLGNVFFSHRKTEILRRNWEEIPVFPSLIAVMWGYFVGAIEAIMWAWGEIKFYNQHSGILELTNHYCYHLLAFLLRDQENKTKKKKIITAPVVYVTARHSVNYSQSHLKWYTVAWNIYKLNGWVQSNCCCSVTKYCMTL